MANVNTGPDADILPKESPVPPPPQQGQESSILGGAAATGGAIGAAAPVLPSAYQPHQAVYQPQEPAFDPQAFMKRIQSVSEAFAKAAGSIPAVSVAHDLARSAIPLRGVTDIATDMKTGDLPGPQFPGNLSDLPGIKNFSGAVQAVLRNIPIVHAPQAPWSGAVYKDGQIVNNPNETAPDYHMTRTLMEAAIDKMAPAEDQISTLNAVRKEAPGVLSSYMADLQSGDFKKVLADLAGDNGAKTQSQTLQDFYSKYDLEQAQAKTSSDYSESIARGQETSRPVGYIDQSQPNGLQKWGSNAFATIAGWTGSAHDATMNVYDLAGAQEVADATRQAWDKVVAKDSNPLDRGWSLLNVAFAPTNLVAHGGERAATTVAVLGGLNNDQAEFVGTATNLVISFAGGGPVKGAGGIVSGVNKANTLGRLATLLPKLPAAAGVAGEVHGLFTGWWNTPDGASIPQHIKNALEEGAAESAGARGLAHGAITVGKGVVGIGKKFVPVSTEDANAQAHALVTAVGNDVSKMPPHMQQAAVTASAERMSVASHPAFNELSQAERDSIGIELSLHSQARTTADAHASSLDILRGNKTKEVGGAAVGMGKGLAADAETVVARGGVAGEALDKATLDKIAAAEGKGGELSAGKTPAEQATHEAGHAQANAVQAKTMLDLLGKEADSIRAKVSQAATFGEKQTHLDTLQNTHQDMRNAAKTLLEEDLKTTPVHPEVAKLQTQHDALSRTLFDGRTPDEQVPDLLNKMQDLQNQSAAHQNWHNNPARMLMDEIGKVEKDRIESLQKQALHQLPVAQSIERLQAAGRGENTPEFKRINGEWEGIKSNYSVGNLDIKDQDALAHVDDAIRARSARQAQIDRFEHELNKTKLSDEVIDPVKFEKYAASNTPLDKLSPVDRDYVLAWRNMRDEMFKVLQDRNMGVKHRADYFTHLYVKRTDAPAGTPPIQDFLKTKGVLNERSRFFIPRNEDVDAYLTQNGYQRVPDSRKAVIAYMQSHSNAVGVHDVIDSLMTHDQTVKGVPHPAAFSFDEVGDRVPPGDGYIRDEGHKIWFHESAQKAIEGLAFDNRDVRGPIENLLKSNPLTGYNSWFRQAVMYQILRHGSNIFSSLTAFSLGGFKAMKIGGEIQKDPAMFAKFSRYSYAIAKPYEALDFKTAMAMPKNGFHILEPFAALDRSLDRGLWVGIRQKGQAGIWGLHMKSYMEMQKNDGPKFTPTEAAMMAGKDADRGMGTKNPFWDSNFEKKYVNSVVFAAPWADKHIRQLIEGSPIGQQFLLHEHGMKGFSPEMASAMRNRMLKNFVRYGATAVGLNITASYALNGSAPWDNEPGHETSVEVTNLLHRMGIATGGKRAYWTPPWAYYGDFYRSFFGPIVQNPLQPASYTAGIRQRLLPVPGILWDGVSEIAQGNFDPLQFASSSIQSMDPEQRVIFGPLSVQQIQKEYDAVKGDIGSLLKMPEGFKYGQSIVSSLLGQRALSFQGASTVGQTFKPLPLDIQKKVDLDHMLSIMGVNPLRATDAETKAAQAKIDSLTGPLEAGNLSFIPVNTRLQEQHDVQLREAALGAGLSEERIKDNIANGRSILDGLSSLQKQTIYRNNPALANWGLAASTMSDPKARTTMDQTNWYYDRLNLLYEQNTLAQQKADATLKGPDWIAERKDRESKLYNELIPQLQKDTPNSLHDTTALKGFLKAHGLDQEATTLPQDVAYAAAQAVKSSDPKYNKEGIFDYAAWQADRNAVISTFDPATQQYIHARHDQYLTDKEKQYETSAASYAQFKSNYPAQDAELRQVYATGMSTSDRRVYFKLHPDLAGYMLLKDQYFTQNPDVAQFYHQDEQDAFSGKWNGQTQAMNVAQWVYDLAHHPTYLTPWENTFIHSADLQRQLMAKWGAAEYQTFAQTLAEIPYQYKKG